MSQPHNLLSSDAPDGLSDGGSRSAPGTSPGGVPGSSSGAPRVPVPGQRRKPSIWLQRSELFLRVAVRLYIGVLVLLLPWNHLWDDNRLLNFYPWLTDFSSNGVVRGIVSGLGLLNLWVAISDAIHYRES